MSELTEDEYELLRQVAADCGREVHGDTGRNEMLASLGRKGLVEQYTDFAGPYRETTKAGVRAMAEYAVRKQFADLDRIVNVDGPGSRMAFVCLERIVRDQARRIAELEAKS